MSKTPAQRRVNFCCPEFKQLRLSDLQLTQYSSVYWDLISRKTYPSITKLLNATWTPEANEVSRDRTSQYSKLEAEWTVRNNRAVGTSFHEYMEQRLNGKPIADYSDLIKALVDSVERAGLIDRLNFSQVIERFVPWDGKYPYVTKLDWFGLMDNEPTVVEWTWSPERLTKLPQLYDKPLQVTAQVKACRDFFALEVERAVIVIAHPFGEATTFTIERERLEKCWKLELQPRLRQFYEELDFSYANCSDLVQNPVSLHCT